MNTLENRIQTELSDAMKSKDTVKTTVLRNIKKSIMEVKTAEKNAIKDPTDDDIIKIIQKMVKELEKANAQFASMGRTDLIESYQKEIYVMKEYLPKMLSEEEMDEIVANTITKLSATTIKDMGKVMGFINKEYAGRIDPSVISKLVKGKLS